MSTTTSNYELIKPALTDVPDITALNPNWDTLDRVMNTFATKGWVTNVTDTGEDLNNYIAEGIYAFSSIYTPANCPANNSAGWLVVIPWSSNAVKQIWFKFGSVLDHTTFVRTKNNSLWSTWAQIYTSKDITVTLGELNSLSGTTANIQNQINSCYKKSGGLLTGNIAVDPETNSPPSVTLVGAEKSGKGVSKSYIAKNATASSDCGTIIRDYSWGGEEDGKYTQLQIQKNVVLKNRLTLVDNEGDASNVYTVYGEHNKPTASDVGAVSESQFATLEERIDYLDNWVYLTIEEDGHLYGLRGLNPPWQFNLTSNGHLEVEIL